MVVVDCCWEVDGRVHLSVRLKYKNSEGAVFTVQLFGNLETDRSKVRTNPLFDHATFCPLS